MTPRLVGLFAASSLVAACSSQPGSRSAAQKAPLYDNLGSHHHPIATSWPEAQKYFDQGLTLSYAFNHAEAIRAFRQAAEIDQSCAMCYWGVAFALGPNINAPMTEDAATEAFQAIEQARQRASSASEKERAYWNPDGTPRAFTTEVLSSLESVLSRKADHLGAIHLYIHAVEASPNPGRAEQYADKLPATTPTTSTSS